jgi:hypothetical protein
MVDEAWLGTVRIARDTGDISSLFPAGVTNVADLPFTLYEAIRAALYFLSFEEVPDPEDRPPKYLWLDEERLAQWWKEVRERREAKFKGEPAINDMPQNQALKEIFPGVNLG